MKWLCWSFCSCEQSVIQLPRFWTTLNRPVILLKELFILFSQNRVTQDGWSCQVGQVLKIKSWYRACSKTHRSKAKLQGLQTYQPSLVSVIRFVVKKFSLYRHGFVSVYCRCKAAELFHTFCSYPEKFVINLLSIYCVKSIHFSILTNTFGLILFSKCVIGPISNVTFK